MVSEVLGTELPLPILNRRHISCFGKDLEGNYVSPPCENLRLSKNGTTHHCGGCGCGDNKLTQLEPGLTASKLLYPNLQCPMKKPGFSNEFEDLDFDQKKRMVAFDANTGGLGDLIASMWLALGYMEMGWDTYYIPSQYDEFIRLCGLEVRNDLTQGAYSLGHQFQPYQVELTGDQGKTPRVPFWASQLPSSPIPRKPTVAIPSTAARVANTNWRTAGSLQGGGGKRILLAPFAHWATRMWPLNHYYELAEMLRKDGHTVMMVGLPSNEAQLRGFPFSYCQLSLMEMIATIDQADVMVCNDSGPAWISTLTDTRTFAMVGPSRNIFGNFDHITQVSNKAMWCTGCHFQKERGYRLACDYGCESLQGLRPSDVHNLIKESLSCLPKKLSSTPTSPKNEPTSS
jgi:hypothetical protein